MNNIKFMVILVLLSGIFFGININCSFANEKNKTIMQKSEMDELNLSSSKIEKIDTAVIYTEGWSSNLRKKVCVYKIYYCSDETTAQKVITGYTTQAVTTIDAWKKDMITGETIGDECYHMINKGKSSVAKSILIKKGTIVIYLLSYYKSEYKDNVLSDEFIDSITKKALNRVDNFKKNLDSQ